MRVGIDVGGTHTDAVLMEAGMVLATAKSRTTRDVSAGIRDALGRLLDVHGTARAHVNAVMVGTTQFTNALAAGEGLLGVGVVRLGLPAGRDLPPLVDWPEPLRTTVGAHVYACRGGHEFDGRRLAPLDRGELERIGRDIAARGIRAVAVSSIFSPANDEYEREAAEIIAAQAPAVTVSLSCEIGRIGLLERENATVINASLTALAGKITAALRAALDDVGISAPVYLSQNDGTLMSADFAERYPVATFSSGPTNSMRGAAVLSGERDCAVIDVGGTTSDLGMLVQGFPRDAKATVAIAGVRTNFRMPDLLSLPIGGGSIVDEASMSPTPHSVGYDLVEQARVFGGPTLTATDVAVAAGRGDIGARERVADLDRTLVAAVLATIEDRLATALDRMKTASGDVPVVLVGGGSLLLGSHLAGASRLIRPPHYAAANAVGAAIAQAGGEVDQIFSIGRHLTRTQAIERARELAVERAVDAGAVPHTVEVVDVEELSIAYVPGNAVRIRVRAVGDLDLTENVLATHR